LGGFELLLDAFADADLSNDIPKDVAEGDDAK
jgi:hypothetical protein